MRLDLIAPKRLPRIRGDRPYGIEIYYGGEAATPHTRGSTLVAVLGAVDKRGYPAYAGIDPKNHTIRRASGGLPRIRGDRPD